MASIFDGLTAPAATQEPSPNERAAQIAEQVKLHARNSVIQFAQAINHGFDGIWNAGNGITPAMVATALGPDALEVFAKHAAAVTFMVQQVPELATFFKQPPAWANIEYEIVDGQPTGRVSITQE